MRLLVLRQIAPMIGLGVLIVMLWPSVGTTYIYIRTRTTLSLSLSSSLSFHAFLRTLGTLRAVENLDLGHRRSVQKACESEQKVVFLRRRR